MGSGEWRVESGELRVDTTTPTGMRIENGENLFKFGRIAIFEQVKNRE